MFLRESSWRPTVWPHRTASPLEPQPGEVACGSGDGLQDDTHSRSPTLVPRSASKSQGSSKECFLQVERGQRGSMSSLSPPRPPPWALTRCLFALLQESSPSHGESPWCQNSGHMETGLIRATRRATTRQARPAAPDLSAQMAPKCPQPTR